jgi:hypothetical protein
MEYLLALALSTVAGALIVATFMPHRVVRRLIKPKPVPAWALPIACPMDNDALSYVALYMQGACPKLVREYAKNMCK